MWLQLNLNTLNLETNIMTTVRHSHSIHFKINNFYFFFNLVIRVLSPVPFKSFSND